MVSYQSDLIFLPHAAHDYRRLVLLVLINYWEVLAWFAFFYWLKRGWFSDPELLRDIWACVYFSIVTQGVLGYGDIFPMTAEGRWLIVAHTAIALFLTVVIVGRIVGYAPPGTSDAPEEPPPSR